MAHHSDNKKADIPLSQRVKKIGDAKSDVPRFKAASRLVDTEAACDDPDSGDEVDADDWDLSDVSDLVDDSGSPRSHHAFGCMCSDCPEPDADHPFLHNPSRTLSPVSDIELLPAADEPSESNRVIQTTLDAYFEQPQLLLPSVTVLANPAVHTPGAYHCNTPMLTHRCGTCLGCRNLEAFAKYEADNCNFN